MAVTNVNYNQASPYYSTPLFDKKFLDLLVYRTIPKLADDALITIPVTYNLRPDLLAFDFYNNADLWWVFAARNPNTIIDPLWDFTAGTQIYVPQKKSLLTALGV